MLDTSFIKERPELIKEKLQKREFDSSIIDEFLKLDDKYKALKQKLDAENTEKNRIAEEVSKHRTEELVARGKIVKSEIQAFEQDLRDVEDGLERLLLSIPNIPSESVPKGNASNNKMLKQEGTLPKFDFTPKDHVELGEILDIIDIPRAVKVSGSRFAYLKNEGVMLEFALVQFALSTLVEKGFTPVIPPVLIKQNLTNYLGYWQGRIDDLHTANENYYLVNDYEEAEASGNHKSNPLYLVGTAEHAIVPMHKDELFDDKELPKKYVAFSSCFRREAGSYGKDTKGILRVHQFDKVEMVEFVKPEEDETEKRKMLSIVEDLMKLLGLPYQVVQLAAGDLSFPAAETIDIETWIPSQEKYRETHSISTTTDFQARRLNIRYKKVELPQVTIPGHFPEKMMVPTVKNEFVHILNGTAFAIGRTIIAILENFQSTDGSVKIPEVLQKYTGFSKISPK